MMTIERLNRAGAESAGASSLFWDSEFAHPNEDDQSTIVDHEERS
jgi:hypothetical protein